MALTTGSTYKHRHIEALTCEVTGITKRGAKVKQYDGKKYTVQFYDFVDFAQNARGLWIETMAPKIQVDNDYWDAYTDGIGNCFSDADPGL